MNRCPATIHYQGLFQKHIYQCEFHVNHTSDHYVQTRWAHLTWENTAQDQPATPPGEEVAR